MRKILFTGLLTLILLRINAQDFKERLTALQQEYAHTTQLHLIMEIEAFESNESKEPFYKETATVKRNGNNSWTRFSGAEMMMNEKYLILINQEAKLMTCATRDTDAENKFYDPMKANLDSIMQLYDTPVLINKNDNVEQYRVKQIEDGSVTLDMYIDVGKNQLTRLDYRYDDGHYVVMRFSLFDTKPSFDSQEFHEGKYLTNVKGKLSPSAKYSKFNLIVN